MMEKDTSVLISILYLSSCAIKGSVPSADFLSKMNWQRVYEVSVFHKLEALTCASVERAITSEYVPAKEEQETYAKWKESKDKAVRNALLLDTATNHLEDFLEKNCIWYLPLKGTVLKELYPKVGMRQMTDCDIFFDKKYQEEVHDYFVAQGYSVMQYNAGAHDVYVKPPVYNFEMHRTLFGEDISKEWLSYYDDIRSKLLIKEGKKQKLFFTTEDFYVYFVAHAYKHHSGGGIGLRTLVDIYVYLNHYEKMMDWVYVNDQLRILELVEYEKNLRALVEKIFIMEQYKTAKDDILLKYMYQSGSHGTVKNKVEHDFQRLSMGEKISYKTFWMYIWNRLYPSEITMYEFYPFFYKHKWARLFCPIYRIIRGLIVHPKKLKKEWNIMLKQVSGK